MLRPVYIVLLIFGLTATAYAAWSWHRISNEALMEDRNWPRASPYPDGWLLALNNWFDARYPASPRTIKLHSEIARVRLTVSIALLISASIALCGAVPLALFLMHRLRRTREFEVVQPSTQIAKTVRSADY